MVATEPAKGSKSLPRRAPKSFRLIAEYPEAGAVAEDPDLAGVRRVVLVDTQHYVYYRVNPSAERIEILAVWSTKFAEPPAITTV